MSDDKSAGPRMHNQVVLVDNKEQEKLEKARVDREKKRLHMQNVAKMRPELKKRMSSFFVQ